MGVCTFFLSSPGFITLTTDARAHTHTHTNTPMGGGKERKQIQPTTPKEKKRKQIQPIVVPGRV